MKIIVTFNIDNNDAIRWNTRVEEAFNRMLNFCPELQAPGGITEKQRKANRSSALVAYNRITSGEFDAHDLDILGKLASTAFDRANASVHPPEVKNSILQAAVNLVTVIQEFTQYVLECWEAWSRSPRISVEDVAHAEAK